MPEVKVTKEKSLAKPETPAPKLFNELFTPMFPCGRLFGLSPFAVMREFTDEMDRVFRGVVPSVESGTWSPTIDINSPMATWL